MSFRSTIFMTNCCHIYKDVQFVDGKELETLCIDVDYLTVDECESIEVFWDSDFAELIRTIFSRLDKEELDKICRDYWEKNIKDK